MPIGTGTNPNETLPGSSDGSNNGGSGAGILGALLAIGGSIYNASVSRKNTKDTIEANKQQAEYAYSKDVESWNRQNAYNDPSAQMDRLKAAGLNPNMVYGTGTSAATGSASPAQMAKYNAPTLKYDYEPVANLPAMIGAYQDFKMRQAQTDNIKAQTDNVRQRTIGEGLKRALMGVKKDTGEFDLRKKESLWTYDVEQKELGLKKTRQDLSEQIQKMRLMSQQELMNTLEQRYREKQIEGAGIQNEKAAAEKMFLDYRNEWTKLGITSGDNVILRIITRMASESGINPGEWFK